MRTKGARRITGAALCALAGLLASAGAAQAQTDACDRYRAELAAIESGGGRDYGALAEQQRVELERMRRYYQGLECGRGARFLVFGSPTSPECAAAEERLGAMEENYSRLLAESARSGNERRAALISAIEQFCGPAEQQPRGFFDTLFNQPGDPPPFMDGPGFPEPDAAPAQGMPVCVRTCDGYFFPLQATPRDAAEAANLCQAQCPAAATAVFWKPQAAPIEQAFSTDGQPYMALPNALRYRTAFDETCSCRAPGQTWSDALAQAEGFMGGGSEVVTPERALELSRPTGAPAPGEPAPEGAAPSIPFFGLDEGEWREVQTQSGPRRVRIVAPEVIPAPDV